GDLDSDVTYAGYFHHAPSGLHAAMFRFYSPQSARWLNRDPLGDAAGTNPYAYAGGDPINAVDPAGLDDGYTSGPWDFWNNPITDWVLNSSTANAAAGVGSGL